MGADEEAEILHALMEKVRAALNYSKAKHAIKAVEKAYLVAALDLKYLERTRRP